MKRKIRVISLAAAWLSMGMVLQVGGCLTAAANTALAAVDFCALLGPDCTFGPIAPCGDPTTSADDLLIDCPKPPNEQSGG